MRTTCEIRSLKMTSKLICALFAILVALPGSASAGGRGVKCLDLLEKAAVTEGQQGEVKAAFERAFAACPDYRALPVGTGARLAAARAEYEHFYRGDPASAIEVYEGALAYLTEKEGRFSPHRIELLEELGRTLDAQANEGRESRILDSRVSHLYLEAQELRERSYGERSSEAGVGLLNLASVHFFAEPEKAEGWARAGLEILEEETGLYSDQTYSALVLLQDILQHRDKEEEAGEMEARISETIQHLYPE